MRNRLGCPKSEEKNNFWGRWGWVPTAYEYEFIIIPKLCISDDTSSTLWHHVPHFRPITYPTHCPSHSSGGRASDSRYRPPVIRGARVRDALALDLLQPPDGDGLRSGQQGWHFCRKKSVFCHLPVLTGLNRQKVSMAKTKMTHWLTLHAS